VPPTMFRSLLVLVALTSASACDVTCTLTAGNAISVNHGAERTATAHRCFITESNGCTCLCDEDWTTATSTPTTFSGSLSTSHPGHANNMPLAPAVTTSFPVEGLATLQGVTLATAQTYAFQNAFVAGLCAQIQVEISSFQCSSITITSISSSSRRRLQSTSSGSVTVDYIIYTASVAEVTVVEQQPIVPSVLVAAVAQAYTGDAMTSTEIGTLTATVDWVPAPPASCASTYSPVVSLDSACDYDATSNTWTSIGSASDITMDTSGMVLDSSMGPLFNDGNGRQIDYNVSPSNHEALTYEIWFYVVKKPTGSQCWILGHDNGGFDRSLNLCDSRYGGIGAGNGGTWGGKKSTLGYVEENAWYHIVVTFKNGESDNMVYVQKVDGALASNSFSANNGDGDQHFSIGGLENFNNHHIKAYIPIVRLYDTRLSQTQVEALYEQDKSRFGTR